MAHEHEHNCANGNCCGGHDHDHDHEHVHEEYDTIVLTLDDDTELECIVLDIFEVEGQEYIALVSVEEEQVLIYQYHEVEGSEDEFTLDTIEDEEEFNRVSDTFNELFVDGFVDEEAIEDLEEE